MQKRRFLGTILALGCGALSVPSRSSERVFVAAMDASYPPFGVRNGKTGKFEGFDVDVIRAIAKAEGFRVEIRNLSFDGLIPALAAGTIDIAINDITITPERSKRVSFSHRYYIAGLGVVVNEDNASIRSAKDLEGKRLAVSIGSTGEEAARKIPGAKLRIFNSLNECYIELANRGADAVVNDIPTNDYYVATRGRGKAKALPVALTKEDLGIAVRKGNNALLVRIDRGLSKIKRNGEFSAIYEKWFGRLPPEELLGN